MRLMEGLCRYTTDKRLKNYRVICPGMVFPIKTNDNLRLLLSVVFW